MIRAWLSRGMDGRVPMTVGVGQKWCYICAPPRVGVRRAGGTANE